MHHSCFFVFFFLSFLHGQHEAAKVMQDAIWQFKETPEEMRVMVANVDLALAKDDVDTALSILQGIPPGKPSYAQAKEKMAYIYLERMRNKKLYVECYRFQMFNIHSEMYVIVMSCRS